MSFRRAHGIPQRHRPVPNPALAPDLGGVVVVRLAAARRRTTGSASSSGAHRAAHEQAGPAPRGTHGVCESPDASDDAQLDGCQPRQSPLMPSEVRHAPCTRATSRVGGFVREDATRHRVDGRGDDRGLVELPRGRGHDLNGRRLSASTQGESPGMHSVECDDVANCDVARELRWHGSFRTL